jgi:hypothetical protein
LIYIKYRSFVWCGEVQLFILRQLIAGYSTLLIMSLQISFSNLLYAQ